MFGWEEVTANQTAERTQQKREICLPTDRGDLEAKKKKMSLMSRETIRNAHCQN